MSYLVINEGLKTVAHNLWSRPIFGTNYGYKKAPSFGADLSSLKLALSSRLGDLGLSAIYSKFGIGCLSFIAGTIFLTSPMILSTIINHFTNGPDYVDKKYFYSMYKITDSLKRKLAKWCKEQKVVDFTQEEKNTSIYDLDNPNVAVASLGANLFDDRTDSLASDTEYLTQSNDKAIVDLVKGNMTTSVIYLIIPSSKNKYYIVFLTFDENKILKAGALTTKTKNYKITGFKVVNLKKFSSVNPREYMK